MKNNISSSNKNTLLIQSLPVVQREQMLIDYVNNLTICYNDQFLVNYYKQALQEDSKNPIRFLQLGYVLKKYGKWEESIDIYERATQIFPNNSRVWRELGIAQNKLYNILGRSTKTPIGEKALIQSINLNPNDHDAFGSLGGIYKRQGKFHKSIDMYYQSLKVSNGDTYPLLNYLILQTREKGDVIINDRLLIYLRRAENKLKNLVAHNPPRNTPWSYFDLSTICLLTKRIEAGFRYFAKGSLYAANWEIETHLNTLLLLKRKKYLMLEIGHFDTSK